MATTSSSSFDVCIRGSGIVGRSLALMLAADRLRVALIHGPSASSGHSDVRAYSLNAAAKNTLTSLRCWPQGDAVTPVLQMLVQGDQGGHLKFDAAEQNVPALNWLVDVTALEEKLAEAVRYQTLIEEVSQPIAAPLTVVCEGRTSTTRAELGVAFEVKHYAQHALACRMVCEHPHAQVARQWFHDQEGAAILAFLPIAGAQSHEIAVVWSLPPERAKAMLEATEEQLCEALGTASHFALGALKLNSARAIWPLQLAHAKRWTGPMPSLTQSSFALAGDAAHAMHPLAGQGLNVGLADVAQLSRVLREREFWRPLNDTKLLRRYERARQADVQAMACITDSLQTLFAQTAMPWQQLRNWGMNGFDRSGPIKHWMAQQAIRTS